LIPLSEYTVDYFLLRLPPTAWSAFKKYCERVMKIQVLESKPKQTVKGGKKKSAGSVSAEVLLQLRQQDVKASKAKEWSCTPNTFQFLQSLPDDICHQIIKDLGDGNCSMEQAKMRYALS